MTAPAPPTTDWHDRAACAGHDTTMWFTAADQLTAKRICRGCPVRAECLHHALETERPSYRHGIFGGLTRNERNNLPALPSSKPVAIAALREHLDASSSRPPAERTSPPMTSDTPPPTTRRKKPGDRYSPEERADNERRTIELLRAGATYQQITDEVGITAPTIVNIRRKAGIPSPGPRGGQQPRPKAEAFAAAVEPYGDGHARWTGPMAGRMPQLFADGTRFNARHVAFEEHHGRPPAGYVRSSCTEPACIAGAHLTDDVLRAATPEEPVTIQALNDLLDEIDTQGGPEAARANRLHLPDHERTQPMTTTPAPAVAPAPSITLRPSAVEQEPGTLTVGQLLKWGDEHPDAEIQAQAARARAALTGLRQRHAADRELTAITTEAAELEKRLAELRAREQELAPTKPKKRAAPVRDYDTRTVRAWAAANGVDCPRVGQIPKRVLDAWRASLPQAG